MLAAATKATSPDRLGRGALRRAGRAKRKEAEAMRRFARQTPVAARQSRSERGRRYGDFTSRIFSLLAWSQVNPPVLVTFVMVNWA